MEYSSCEKLIDLLVLNFKAMFLAQVKVRKKDFCMVLAKKLRKCRDRAALNKKLWNFSINISSRLILL